MQSGKVAMQSSKIAMQRQTCSSFNLRFKQCRCHLRSHRSIAGDRYHHHHHRHHVDCETSQSGSCAIRLPRAFHHHGLPVLSMHSANLPVQCPSAHQRNSQLLDPFRWFSVFRLADVPDRLVSSFGFSF